VANLEQGVGDMAIVDAGVTILKI